MTSQLSPYRLGKAREVFNLFNVFNAVSWNFLVGIIITLLALRLDASSTYIGLLSSSSYASLLLLPIGKMLAKRFSIIGIFSFTWIVRSICMALAVAAPVLDYMGHRSTALFFILLGVFAFHILRGIGLIGNNPVLSALAVGPDRGSYMTQVQIINSAIGMFSSFFIAMILGLEPPIFIFSILLTIGVITGVVSGLVIRNVPEPPRSQSDDETKKKKLFDIFKDALAQDNLKHFMLILFLVVLVSGVSRTFVVVYAREVFAHNDGLISMYSVFGGLGFLIAGLSIKFLVDRIGAKPLFIVCVIIGLASMFPVVLFPQAIIDNVTGAILFLFFLFFMLNFGFLGSEGIAQTYFLSLIPSEKMLDMGILYFFIFGAAGAGGSFLAGLFLDLFSAAGLPPFYSFKILFAVLILMTIIALAMQNKMKSLGSLPLKGALEVIFSFRDLRAISLLDKLNKTQDSQQEELLLGELHDTPSHLAINGLLERTKSPRLATRQESIRALEKLHHLSEKAETALIDDIANNQYTTAYISARILGKHGCKAAVPILRESVFSNDYMLAGEAMIALAKMNDKEFRAQMEKNILDSNNPRLLIMGVEALGIYLCPESIFVLLEIMRKAGNNLFLLDEIVLAIAAILGAQKKFYPVLAQYAADNSLAVTLGMDEAEAAYEYCKSITGARKKRANKSGIISEIQIELFQTAVREYMENKKGTELSRWILEAPDDICEGGDVVKTVLAEAVLDNDLCEFDSLRLLIVQWSANGLRLLTSKVK